MSKEKYSPQKHEWGTDAATLWAKSVTPGETPKKEKTVTVEEGKSFFEIRESMKSADRVPQTYRDPDTGKMITRMVRHSKNIVDKDKGKDKDVEEAVRIRDRARQQFDPSHGKKDGSMQSAMDRHNIAKAAVDRRKVTRGGGVKGFNSKMVGKKPQDASQDIGSVRARKEEVEQVDELSKNLLRRYSKKADKQMSHHMSQIDQRDPDKSKWKRPSDASTKSFNKRVVGKMNAHDKIKGKYAKVPATDANKGKRESKTYDSGWRKIKKDDKKVSPMDRVKQLAQKGMKKAEKK